MTYTAVVIMPVAVAGVLASFLVNQLFHQLHLHFDWGWWVLLLTVNFSATALSIALGHSVSAPGATGPSYPMASFSLAIGVVASLSLHAASVFLQVLGGQTAAQGSSITGFVIAQVLPTPLDDWVYLVLAVITCAAAMTLGVATAHSFRRDAKHSDSFVYFVAIVLFVINSLFLQAWVTPPENAQSITGLALDLVLGVAFTITLTYLLYIFARHLPGFFRSAHFQRIRQQARGAAGVAVFLARFALGTFIGLLAALLIVFGVVALGALAYLAIGGLHDAYIFVSQFVWFARALVQALFPWLLGSTIALGVTAIAWRPVGNLVAAIDLNDVLSSITINRTLLWVFGLALGTAAGISLTAYHVSQPAWLNDVWYLLGVGGSVAVRGLVAFILLGAIASVFSLCVLALASFSRWLLRVLLSSNFSLLLSQILTLASRTALVLVSLVAATAGFMLINWLIVIVLSRWADVVLESVFVAALLLGVIAIVAGLAVLVPKSLNWIWETLQDACERLKPVLKLAPAIVLSCIGIVGVVLATTPFATAVSNWTRDVAPIVYAVSRAAAAKAPGVFGKFVEIVIDLIAGASALVGAAALLFALGVALVALAKGFLALIRSSAFGKRCLQVLRIAATIALLLAGTFAVATGMVLTATIAIALTEPLLGLIRTRPAFFAGGILLIAVLTAASAFVPSVIAVLRRFWLPLAAMLRRRWRRAALVLVVMALFVALSPIYDVLLRQALLTSNATVHGLERSLRPIPVALGRFVIAAAMSSAIVLLAVAAASLATTLALTVGGLARQFWAVSKSRPVTAALAAFAAALIPLTPVVLTSASEFLAHLHRHGAGAGNTPIRRPEPPGGEVFTVQRLVFEQNAHWRFNSIDEVTSPTGAKSIADAIRANSNNICGRQDLIVIGAASSDGSPAYNRQLAQCRTLSVGEALTHTLATCRKTRTHRVWLLDLGVSMRDTSSASDRIIIVAATDGVRENPKADDLNRAVRTPQSQLNLSVADAAAFAAASSQVVPFSDDMRRCREIWPQGRR